MAGGLDLQVNFTYLHGSLAMTGKWIEEGGIKKVDGLYLKMGWILR
jgi:hypothetical protein